MNRNLSFIGFIIIALFTQCKNAPEISQWRGPNRDGIYPEKNLLKEWPEGGPELIWKYDNLGEGYASASVLSDKVITIATLDSISYVIAFDHEGGILYKKELGPEWMTNFPGNRSTPLLYDGHGYVLSGLGILYCFDVENGESVWTKDVFTDFDGKNVTYGISENLLIDGDKLFCTPGGEKDNIIALNRYNGELIWESKGNGEVSAYCSPILIEIGKEKFLVTMTANSVISLNSNNGELAWTYPLVSKSLVHSSAPIFQDGHLLILDGYEANSVMLKIIDDGYAVEKVFGNKLFDNTIGSAFVDGNKIIGTNFTKNSWFCINWVTGKEKSIMEGLLRGSVIFADGMLYIYTINGEVGLVNPTSESFELISSFKIPNHKNNHFSHPVIYNGRLYVRHDNSLFVYNIKS